MVYGLVKNYNKRNPESLRTSENKEERGWYSKGIREEWFAYFNLQRIRERGEFQNFGEWAIYGLEKEFYNCNPKSLEESKVKKIRSWYKRGCEKKWINKFTLKRKKRKNEFVEFKNWISYGLRNSLHRQEVKEFTKNDISRSWYRIGSRKRWLKYFNKLREKGGNYHAA